MPRLRDLSLVVLGLTVLSFGLVADFALVAQGLAAREKAATATGEAARVASVSLTAAVRAIEEEVLAGRAVAAVKMVFLAVSPDPMVTSMPGVPYARRSRSELSRLLGSTAVTPSGLPEAVVARIALGDAGTVASGQGSAPDVGEQLLEGDLPVRPEDLARLARALGLGADPRVQTLADALRAAPAADRLPEAPSFRRVAESGRTLRAWSRVEGKRVGYEMAVSALLDRAGLAGRARPSAAAAAEHGHRVSVPDVDGLDLSLFSTGTGDERIRTQRLLLWVAVATSVAGLLAVRRALGREARAMAREKAFLATVTHELRTPLASIRLLAETLADGRGHPLDYGTLVARESERLESLVESVLSAARLEDAPRFASVEPGELVRSTVALLTPRAERRAMTLQYATEELPAVTWDGEAVRRALVNLLDNAIRYGREGGRVDVRAAKDRESVALSVRDDGPGLSRHERSSIFGRFVRGRDQMSGAGLGLYLVDQVARAHGGRVDLETEEGRGSTFTLVLPLVPPAARGGAS